jgi:hypothetical protein
MLDSNEFVEKHADSDDSEFSDTGESSDTNFNYRKDDVLLLDIRDE